MAVSAPVRKTEQIEASEKKQRIEILDALRGAGILYVVIYHVLYDIQCIFFPETDCGIFDLGSLFMRFTHILLVGMLFFVSGICTAFSRSVLKRGLFIFALGELLTVGTYLFMPDMLIRFGVLTFLGTSMLLYGLIKPIADKINHPALCVFWLILFFMFRTMPYDGFVRFFAWKMSVPEGLYEYKFLYPLGIMSAGFRSADYFPLIPYGFIFMAGTSLSAYIKSKRDSLPRFCMKRVPLLCFMGRHSLIIYFVHQPLAFGILALLEMIIH